MLKRLSTSAVAAAVAVGCLGACVDAKKRFDDFGDRVKAGIKEAAGLTDDERDDLRARFVSAFLNRKRDLGFGRARR